MRVSFAAAHADGFADVQHHHATTLDKGHGRIENRRVPSGCWILVLTFHEDHSRIRAGHATENFVVLRHIALNLLQRQQTKRLSVIAKRKKAGWDNAYLLQILQGI